jgi:amidophosphoribosyltransferase
VDAAEGAVKAAERLQGAFSLVLLTGNGQVIALRDPHGFRPLCVGKNEKGVAFASESCALESCGFTFVRDVKPGEIIVAENGRIISEAERLQGRPPSFIDEETYGICLFEYIYFARPDSVVEGASVYKARYNMGRILAREHPVDKTEDFVVCGVPDTGIEAAIGYSEESGIPLVSGFVRNRYVGRSFIYSSQSKRENAVRLKLNPLRASVENKKVVLVDDSIIRGTTAEPIIRSLKSAGAKEVHMRISSPPFTQTCHFGTDLGDAGSLIANRMTVAETARFTGADSFGYLSLAGLKEACAACRLPFCEYCFTGKPAFALE